MRRLKTISICALVILLLNFLAMHQYLYFSETFWDPMYFLQDNGILGLQVVVAGFIALFLSEIWAPTKRNLRLIFCILVFAAAFIACELITTRFLWTTRINYFGLWEPLSIIERNLWKGINYGVLMGLFQFFFLKSKAVNQDKLSSENQEILDL